MPLASVLLASVVVLKGATIHTASGLAIPSGVLIVNDGRIEKVGDASMPIPPGAKVIDVSGKEIAPPFFLPATTIGLVEIDSVRGTLDVREAGAINPEAQPEIAINFDSELLPVARSGGVLFASVTPSGSVLPGAASVVRLDGFTREDACLKCPAAILIEWPDMKLDRSLEPKELEAKRKGRDEAIDRITHAFQDARSYQAARTAGKESGRISSMEALLPVLEGKRPLMIRASSKQQIDRALRWVEEDLASPGSKVILLTSSDAVSVAGKLAALKIPVILDEVLRVPQRADEPYDVAFSAAAALVKAGVIVAIGGGTTDPASARNLPHQAATAVGHGLDRLVALQSITLNPAKIFGLDSVIGSLEPGKEASFVIWSGNPLDLRSRVEALYHRGQSIDLSDRQKRLWDRYKKRPKPAVTTPAVAATPIAPVTPVAPAGP